jgi:hypothetical protein
MIQLWLKHDRKTLVPYHLIRFSSDATKAGTKFRLLEVLPATHVMSDSVDLTAFCRQQLN